MGGQITDWLIQIYRVLEEVEETLDMEWAKEIDFILVTNMNLKGIMEVTL